MKHTSTRKRVQKDRQPRKLRSSSTPTYHPGMMIVPFVIVVVGLLAVGVIALYLAQTSMVPTARPAQIRGPRQIVNTNIAPQGVFEEGGKVCYNYSRNDATIKYCANCEDGLCEMGEPCTSSVVAANGSSTPDCGPLYCPQDCEAASPN